MVERRTHDYLRHGTTSLFAAFNTEDGTVISSLHRHRTIEFKKFLTKIDVEVPERLDVHLILENYGTHKSPAIRRWLARGTDSCFAQTTSPTNLRRGTLAPSEICPPGVGFVSSIYRRDGANDRDRDGPTSRPTRAGRSKVHGRSASPHGAGAEGQLREAAALGART